MLRQEAEIFKPLLLLHLRKPLKAAKDHRSYESYGLQRMRRHRSCHGTSPTVCPECHGSGVQTVSQRTPLGVMSTQRTCSRCGGKGKIINTHATNVTARVRSEQERKSRSTFLPVLTITKLSTFEALVMPAQTAVRQATLRLLSALKSIRISTVTAMMYGLISIFLLSRQLSAQKSMYLHLTATPNLIFLPELSRAKSLRSRVIKASPD